LDRLQVSMTWETLHTTHTGVVNPEKYDQLPESEMVEQRESWGRIVVLLEQFKQDVEPRSR
jgi:hypothetical protein